MKRKSKRLHSEIMLNVASLIEPHKSGAAAISDISKTGVAFASNVDLKVGDEVTMRFSLSDDDMYIFIGIVRRIEEFTSYNKYGVEFMNLKNSKTRRKIKKLIRRIV